ncbi:MAG: c-type cytochrome [Sandaracinaceae bacterium]
MSGLAERVSVAILLSCLSCTPELPFEPTDPVEAAEAFVADPAVRRGALEWSTEGDTSAYAALRLEHYGLGPDEPDGWDALPVLRRGPVRPLRATEPGEEEGEPFDAVVVDEPSASETLADYVEVGRRAFELYPMQVDLRFDALRDAEQARAFGLTVESDGRVRGAAELRAADGSWLVAITCEACHSTADGEGTFRPGLSNPDFDLAGLLEGPFWRPGTMDVTADGVENPLRASDLRPLVHQARMQHTGNLRNGRIARMVRIETLMGGQRSWRDRPDRRMVASVALYVESLADALPRPRAAHPGAALFEASCAGCHRGDAMAGGVVPLMTVGTDPNATGDLAARGTVGYRAPSLLGAGQRRGLLHDGSVRDLPALLGLDASEHEGHRFGLTASVEEREALVSFLNGE